MKISIIGPNLMGGKARGDFHIHAAGCADVRREMAWFCNPGVETVEVSTMLDVSALIYDDMISGGEMSLEDGMDSFWFAPCTAELPYGPAVEAQS